MALTREERYHWKDRISKRLDAAIEKLWATHPGLKDELTGQAQKRAKSELGFSPHYEKLRKLDEQISELTAVRDEAQAEFTALIRGCSLSVARQANNYYVANEATEAVNARAAIRFRELLAETETGKDILGLESEKENLIDSVWLATSTSQVKTFWEKVGEILGQSTSKIERAALEIPAVAE